jgi:hypothetical protein
MFMTSMHVIRPLLLAVTLASTVVLAQTKQTTAPYEPEVGQEGKDVVWVPTPQTVVDKMLDMAKVSASDYVMDLGSGDGRTVISAAKRGARAVGIEYNPDMVALSQRAAVAAKVTDKATFVQADLFATDFSKANVLTMFLLPEINLKLRPKILELRPGTRVVSNTFTMDTWSADETFRVTDDCTAYCTVLLWIVPAKVQGKWKLPDGSLTLAQEFQMLTGTLETADQTLNITDGKMRGTEITFIAGGTKYTGRVNGRTMDGTRIASPARPRAASAGQSAKSGPPDAKWHATRVSS